MLVSTERKIINRIQFVHSAIIYCPLCTKFLNTDEELSVFEELPSGSKHFLNCGVPPKEENLLYIVRAGSQSSLHP